MVDVTVQNACILHKKSEGNMIYRIFKEDLAQTYLARYNTPPKKSTKFFMSNNGGRKRVVDELQYNGIEHYLVETSEKKRRICAGDNCTKRISIQCSKCDVGLCLGCNISFYKK